MQRDYNDLVRYTPGERLNHWIVGISFILLGLSGLALFHPAFWPFTLLFGGGTWTRILHPYLGVLMAVAYIIMLIRFTRLNLMTATDWQWVRNVRQMVDGDDHNMPEQGKYNGGQKLLFWLLFWCMLLLILSGVALWRAWFNFPVEWVRLAAVVHSASAAVMIGLIMVHVYAAIWTKGTIRAMWYGTVTRAWAKQHHRGWYKEVTKEG
ncbi:formate dehydrogenase subunit gamma [Candidatus Thiodictyon syntrophicum]|jgi:formate dehydrogenase subunit gamma|uniref:Formate dehydrogenase subunit gamma n=1 Tax=Candidatus Thiodictyon syntrophicum TaxID=1166950 RepID=A0A2K8UFF9_9GAMM|nr:formate dehydrogenase subunit gamma [Candidatus Thiodictyon syntrophicum]AUB84285.1 formate dehydrogenase subunit gamma [Candidatus Thiodictyon syntrophicum]